MKKLMVVLVVLVLIVPAAAQETAIPEMVILPEEVVFEALAGLQPEGVEWDSAAGTFLVGSLSTGTISSVADDGTLTERFSDEQLASTVGIHIADGKLYVANSSVDVFSDPTATGLASLAVFDLESGELLSFTDLTTTYDGEGGRFANDVTVDGDGNAYVTDTMQPVIYRVTPEGEGSVFLESDLFSAEEIGLNGIDFHPDGYLLAAVSFAGAIFKIPLDDPQSVAAVELSEPIAIDGMAIGSDGVLYAVGYTGENMETQEILALTSEDEWATALVMGRIATDGNATTLALRYPVEGEPPAVYYVNAYLGDMERTEYQIVRAPLEASEPMGG